MHTEPTLTKCTKCDRQGAMRENGIPAGWRLELQDQLLCPVCWGPPAPALRSHQCFKCGTWLDDKDRDANGTKHHCGNSEIEVWRFARAVNALMDYNRNLPDNLPFAGIALAEDLTRYMLAAYFSDLDDPDYAD